MYSKRRHRFVFKEIDQESFHFSIYRQKNYMLKVIGFQVIYSDRNIYDRPTNFKCNKKALHFQINFFFFFLATTATIISYTKVTITIGLPRKNNYLGIK